MSDESQPAAPEELLDPAGVPRHVAEDRARVARAIADAAAHVASGEGFGGVLAEIVGQTRALGAKSALLYLAEGDGLRLVAWHNLPERYALHAGDIALDGSFVTAVAARTRQLQIRTEAELGPGYELTRRALQLTSSHSLVSVPLVSHGALIGVVSWLRAAPDRPTDAEIEATESLVGLYATALETARLRERDRQRTELLAAVRQAALRMGETLDLKAVLQAVVEEGRLVVGAEFAALGVVDHDFPDGPFRNWVYTGVDEAVAQAIGRIPRPVGVLGAVVKENAPVRVWDVRADPRFRGLPPGHPEIRAFLGVPIRLQGSGVGNLYFANKRGAAAFTELDEEAAMFLAGHAAIAIDNARVHSRLRREVERRREAESEREHLLQQLDAERRWLRAVFHNTPMGIALVHAADQRLELNEHGARMLGLEGGKSFVVSDLARLVRDADGAPLPLDRHPCMIAQRGEMSPPAEYRVTRDDGSTIPVQIVAAPIRRDDGTIEGVVKVFDDLTERKHAERMRDEWSSVIAHDLRQPVTTITAFASAIARTTERDTELTKRVSHIRSAAWRLDRMISDLLDLSRLESGRFQIDRKSTDVAALVRDAIERTRPELGEHEVVAKGATGAARFCVDPERIEQVLYNLLTNAAKYGEAGATIEVELLHDRNALEIAVHNRGPGIPPGEEERIFTRYYRSSAAQAGGRPGLGLGLYMSRRLVEAHGGTLTAASVPDGLTTFRIRLPAA